MKKLIPLLPLGLLFTACQTTTPAPQPTDPAIVQITGRVSSGTGTGTIELRDGVSAGAATLSSASIAADGSFTLPLPTPDKLAGSLVSADTVLGQLGCEGTLTSGTPGTRAFGFAELQATRSGATMQVMALSTDLNFLPPHLAFKGHAWVYTDQATTLKGELDCTKLINSPDTISRLTVSVDTRTRAGWNVLELAGRTSGVSLPTSASASASVVQDVTGSNWRTVNDIARGITTLSAQVK